MIRQLKSFGVKSMELDMSRLSFSFLRIHWQENFHYVIALQNPWRDLFHMCEDAFPDSLLDFLARLVSNP
jgi:hypothetical protein